MSWVSLSLTGFINPTETWNICVFFFLMQPENFFQRDIAYQFLGTGATTTSQHVTCCLLSNNRSTPWVDPCGSLPTLIFYHTSFPVDNRPSEI